MSYTHYHVGDYINLPAEPPVGTVLRARLMRDGKEVDRFTVTHAEEGWHVGRKVQHPVPWRVALDAWGPGSDRGWSFEVIKLPED
jgi:hypothetical protein